MRHAHSLISWHIIRATRPIYDGCLYEIESNQMGRVHIEIDIAQQIISGKACVKVDVDCAFIFMFDHKSKELISIPLLVNASNCLRRKSAKTGTA